LVSAPASPPLPSMANRSPRSGTPYGQAASMPCQACRRSRSYETGKAMGMPSRAAASISRWASKPPHALAASSSAGRVTVSRSRVPSGAGVTSQWSGRTASLPWLHEYSSSRGGSQRDTALSMTRPESEKSSRARPPGLSSIVPGASHRASFSGSVSMRQTVCWSCPSLRSSRASTRSPSRLIELPGATGSAIGLSPEPGET